MFLTGADSVAFSTNGAERLSISTTQVLSTLPFRAAAASAAAPAYSFSSADTNTGMYRVGEDNIGFSTGGTLRFDISTTAVTSTLQLVVPALDVNDADALGGGAAPTFGTIGGTGPTAAAQARWLRISIGGVPHWVPVWV
jgi:hypothetical protein